MMRLEAAEMRSLSARARASLLCEFKQARIKLHRNTDYTLTSTDMCMALDFMATARIEQLLSGGTPKETVQLAELLLQASRGTLDRNKEMILADYLFSQEAHALSRATAKSVFLIKGASGFELETMLKACLPFELAGLWARIESAHARQQLIVSVIGMPGRKSDRKLRRLAAGLFRRVREPEWALMASSSSLQAGLFVSGVHEDIYSSLTMENMAALLSTMESNLALSLPETAQYLKDHHIVIGEALTDLKTAVSTVRFDEMLVLANRTQTVSEAMRLIRPLIARIQYKSFEQLTQRSEKLYYYVHGGSDNPKIYTILTQSALKEIVHELASLKPAQSSELLSKLETLHAALSANRIVLSSTCTLDDQRITKESLNALRQEILDLREAPSAEAAIKYLSLVKASIPTTYMHSSSSRPYEETPDGSSNSSSSASLLLLVLCQALIMPLCLDISII